MNITVRDNRKGNWFWASNDLYNCGLDVYALALYGLLCSMADNHTQRCYPGGDYLAKHLECSPRQVRKTISVLAARGMIKVTRQASESGMFWRNQYTVLGVPENEEKEEKPQRVEKKIPKPPIVGQAPGDDLVALGAHKQDKRKSDHASEVWDLALQELRLTMSKNAYARWLSGSTATEVAPNVLDVEICDSYAKRWLETRLQFDVERRVSGIAGRAMGIVWHVR